MRGGFRIASALLACCSFLPRAVDAFYIPGFSIKSYADGESIPLFVNKVYSDNTQIQYAYSELPFVCPASGRRHGSMNLISGSSVSLNLGEILRGDRITVSDYELTMGNDDEIRYLCSRKVDKRALARAKEVVGGGYVAEWIVDNLPGATQFRTVDRTRKYYAAGFKMGYEDTPIGSQTPRYYLNNHVTLVLRYHTAPGSDGQHGKKVIVGFEVYPKSVGIGNRDKDGLPTDLQHSEDPFELTMRPNSTSRLSKRAQPSYVPSDDEDEIGDDATITIPYTYSVYFREEENIGWSNRWELYFVNQEDSSSIHWLAIVNSLVIASLLAAVVAVILGRTIRGDIKSHKELGSGLEDGKTKAGRSKSRGTKSPAKSTESRKAANGGAGLLEQPNEKTPHRHSDDSSDDESVEDITGWKLVHADVFRAPAYGQILAPLIGSGMQLLFMFGGLLLLSCFGILNPSFRGGFISVGIGLFVLAGLLSGFISARMYKTFGGLTWQRNAVITASLFPGLLFATVFVLNLFVWAQASSTALPFGTLVSLVLLWLLIQLPLVYVGSWYGFVRRGEYIHPIKASSIPRQIPAQAWWTRSTHVALMAGLVPFAVIFIELMFVFQSVWQDKSAYYYVFGFLAVVSTVLVLTVVEVTIVVIYVTLCYENYHWWWQSFFTGASSSVWVFFYCAYYYSVKLHIQGFVSSLLFFAYSALACTVYGLLMGTVGFITAYTFVGRIYSAIKVD